jgi:gliding motility-associated-like protein
MKRVILSLFVFLNLAVLAQPCTFVITPPSPLQITCSNTFVVTTASPSAQNYTWSSISQPPQFGDVATFTAVGVYTVAAQVGTCSSTQTLSVVYNTVAPVTSVSPANQAIDCNTNTAVTFSGTCTNPTVNLQHDWYSSINPYPAGPPIQTNNNTLTILAGNIPPGIYTLVTTNQVTGCQAFKTVTVTSLSAYPTFSINSPTNFSLGCVPLNQTTLAITNAQSTQSPAATCSYTFLAPGFSGTVAQGVQFGTQNATVAAIPGTWTVIVEDNSNFCKSYLSVPVVINTVGPHVLATYFTNTLTCYNPTVMAVGSSTTNNTTMSWLVPSVPPSLSSASCVIGIPANGPATGTTSLTYATFTVVGYNNLNACETKSAIPIFQNFKLPISSPTISVATPTAIYCSASVAPCVLTTGQSTTTSGGGPTAFVANPCWSGPSPQTSTCGPSSYSCYVPGIYSLQVQDNYNGCYGSGTVNVLDRTQPPVLTASVNQATLDCGGSTNAATLNLALTGTMTGGVRFLITTYPTLTPVAFSPSSAIVVNINPDLSGTSSSVITVDKVGAYYFIVTNTLTGCKANGTVNVVAGGLIAGMDPSPSEGYAPLTVSFFNNSTSSLGSSSITSVWDFGNGTAQTTTINTSTSATYTAPGTYTVRLTASKGVGCVDTAYKIIKVDIPSKLEVPNVFTPNGDGSNDVFFLKVANLEHIDVFIIDRWGNKVYETESHTGNIAWDGKNFAGKECASGVYFYVITAKGKDDTEYTEKGSVSLFR